MADLLEPFDAPSCLQPLPVPGADILWTPALFSPAEAAQLFDALYRSIAWRQEDILLFGKRIPQPRLTAWHGDADAHYQYSGLPLTPLPWTDVLLHIRQRVEGVTQTHFNSVLLNLYRDGRDSMGWHSDNERELGDAPTIASVSLGQTRLFQWKPRKPRTGKTVSLELNAGSLLVMCGTTQRDFVHAVPKNPHIEAPRINLTFRMIGARAT
jgi:alkylated DNA repair dioxygenase AlkB